MMKSFEWRHCCRRLPGTVLSDRCLIDAFCTTVMLKAVEALPSPKTIGTFDKESSHGLWEVRVGCDFPGDKAKCPREKSMKKLISVRN